MRPARRPASKHLVAIFSLAIFSLSASSVRAKEEEHKKEPQHQAPKPPPQRQTQQQRPQQQQQQRQAPQQQQQRQTQQQFHQPPPQQQRQPLPQQNQNRQFNERAQTPQQREPQQREPQQREPQQQTRQQPPARQENSFQRGPQNSPAQNFQRPVARPAYSMPEGHAQMGAGARPERLNPNESHAVVSQVNGARAGMHGYNAAPLPQGNVSVRAGGALHIEAAGGRAYGVRANGTMQSYSSPAIHAATFRADGHIATMRTASGLRINRSPNGERVIFHPQPNGSIVVSNGPHYGYVQREVVYRNRAYVQRTYVVNGAVYTRSYHPYYYGGIVMNRYTPSYYYGPAYYRYAYTPWQRPVEYSWGWRASPWYGYYGGYFTPMPVYPTPAYWLGDYILAAELRESYDERVAARAQAQADANAQADAQADAEYSAQSAPSPITPEVRAMIAEEVQRQLAEEGEAAANYQAPPPAPAGAQVVEVQPAGQDPAPQPQANAQLIAPADGSNNSAPPAAPQATAETPIFLQTPGRIFVVSASLDVVVDTETCSLSSGDVLRLDSVPPAGDTTAPLKVLSSKAQDCSAGAVATLSVDDLQEMYNNLHEKIDSGLGDLKTAQGNGGMPAAPPAATETTPGPGAAAPPPADNSAALLAQTQKDADAAEAELDQEMKNPPQGQQQN